MSDTTTIGTIPGTDIEREIDRVRAIRTTLIIHHPFFASIMLPMRIRVSLTLPTFAATNCHDTIWFNPAWTRALSLKGLGYVLLHEAGHVAFLHALRKGPRDHDLWNLSTDYADNAMIDEVRGADGKPLYERPEHVTIPGVGTCSLVTADWATNLSAEQIYEQLLQDATNVASHDGAGDHHPDQTPSPPNDAAGHGQSGEPDWSQTPCQPGQTCAQVPVSLTADQAERLTDRVIAAHEAWIASQQRGSLPGAFLRLINQLRAGKVPWQRVLHQYAGQALAKEDCSLFPPHKRWLSEHDIVRPSCRSERMGQLVVAIDTSGSISQPTLKAFASEIALLHTLSEETLILTCDAAIHQVIRTSEVPQFLATLQFKGGGGTSHVPVFAWLADHRVRPDLFVGLTDLHTQYPDRRPSYPVLWSTPGLHGEPPPWGRVVVIPDEEM